MNRIALALMLVVTIAGCRQNDRRTEINIAQITADTTVVNVFYFHGKQRCETCDAVAEVAQKTVETAFAGNRNVRFVDLDSTDKSIDVLIEKYEVTWNALIIAKGENAVDITQHAFNNAVKRPQSVENLIKDEVNKRLVSEPNVALQ